jgi:hypothetical protein
MAAAAIYDPSSISSRFDSLGNGKYRVNFQEGRQVTIDTDLPIYADQLIYGRSTDKSPEAEPELWVSLLEKAYALEFGGGSYSAIERGNFGTAFERITGVKSDQHRLEGIFGVGAWTSDKIFSEIKNAIDSGKAVCISTKKCR